MEQITPLSPDIKIINNNNNNNNNYYYYYYYNYNYIYPGCPHHQGVFQWGPANNKEIKITKTC